MDKSSNISSLHLHFMSYLLPLKGEHHQQPPSPKPALPPKRRSSSSVSSQGMAAQPAPAPAPAQPIGAAAAATLAASQPGVVMVGGNPMVIDPATGMLQPQPQPQPAFLQSASHFLNFIKTLLASSMKFIKALFCTISIVRPPRINSSHAV